jgi:Family of unknown function (DUF6011)
MTTTRKQITAKFTGKCVRCGGVIPSGTQCTWAQGEGVRHINCTVTAVAKHNDNATPRTGGKVAVTMGVFKKDSKVYVVKPNRDKTRVYAKEIVESPARMTESGLQVDFEAVYRPGIVFALTEADRMDLADASDFLTKYARCIVCGRHLKAAKSVARAIGPVCAGYFKNSSHVNGCAHHDSVAPQGAAAAVTPAPREADLSDAIRTTQYAAAHAERMAALRAEPLTDDEKALVAHIEFENEVGKRWMAANPGAWSSGLVTDIAHWRDYGIRSLADMQKMQAAEDEKERRKNFGWVPSEAEQQACVQHNADLNAIRAQLRTEGWADPRPMDALTAGETRYAELL